MPVWDKVGAGKTLEGEEEELGEEMIAAEVEAEADDATEATRLPQETPIEGPALPDHQGKEKKKPGRQKGMVGHGRTQALPVTAEERHLPCTCLACHEALPGKGFVARFGFYSVGLVPGAEQAPGRGVTHTKHLYGDITCQKCGHCHRSEPGRAVPEALDKTLWPARELTEWRRVEPDRASLIAFLYFRAPCSYTIIPELLEGWCGIPLSTATLNHPVHELGYAAEPVEEPLAHEIVEDCLVHGDETSWLEAGEMWWLGGFVTSSTCLYQMGSRGLEIIDTVLGGFLGRLMSDGYVSYRHFKNRLRCWAPLLRNAIGLAESTDSRARAFGKKPRDLLEQWMAAIDEARENPPAVPLPVTWAAALQSFRQLCEE
jgi:hypothetical protein